MASCAATTKDGRPCPNNAGEGGFCFTHDPAKAADRAAARRRGGKRRRVNHVADAGTVPAAVRDTGDVLRLLDYTLGEAVALENSVQRTRALTAMAAAYLDVFRVGELEQRLDALEQRLADRDDAIRV